MRQQQRQKEDQVAAQRAEREAARQRLHEDDLGMSEVAAGSSFDVTEADSEQCTCQSADS